MSPGSTEDAVRYPREVPPGEPGPVYPAPFRIGVWEALRRKWAIVAVTTVVFGGAGLALALSQAPTYTAQSRLAVGRLDVSAPGAVSNFAVATQALADQYSRVVGASEIVTGVGRKLRMSPLEVARDVSGSPIPESPVFRIEATASSEQRAVALAAATSDALVKYTTKLNRSNPDSPRLFNAFKGATLTLNRRRERESRLRGAVGSNPSSANLDELARAKTSTDTANLEAQTLRNAYEASRGSQSATSLVQILTKDVKASSDRASILQLYVFIGLLAGLSLGLALALVLAQREARRALAAG